MVTVLHAVQVPGKGIIAQSFTEYFLYHPLEHLMADSLIFSCKGLVIWDREDGMVRFAHHTVQQFLLAGSIGKQANYLRFDDSYAERYVGMMCLTYLLFSDFETQIQTRPADVQPQQPLDIPQVGPVYWIPDMLGVRASKIDRPLRRLGLGSTSSSVDPKYYAKHLKSASVMKISTPSAETVEKYALLQYIIENWVFHTKGFESSIASGQKLQDLAMHKKLPFEFRPWGQNQHYGPYGCGSCKPGGSSYSEAEQLPFMSLFHYAAEVGNFSLMEPLIKEYCSHEMKDSSSRGLLWDEKGEHCLLARPLLKTGRHTWEKKDWAICLAIHNGHLSIFEDLLVRYARFFSAAAYATILNAAASSGNKTVFEKLIRDVLRSGRWELYTRRYAHITGAFAAANGHQAILELLCREPGDLSFDKRVDSVGETAISAAAANGHDHVVQFLLAKGAQVAMEGVTPLHRAAENGHTAVAHTLLNAGQNCPMDHSNNILDPPHMIGAQDSEGETPVQRAARNGHAGVVRLMFENIPTSKEKWLLATATKTAESQDLIKEGTALHLAAANGHLAVVKLFYGPMDHSQTEGIGRIILISAVKGNHVQLVEWLLGNGDGTENQSDALRVAVGKGYQLLVQLFLNRFPKLVTHDLLVLAAKNGHEEILEHLISAHNKVGVYAYPDITTEQLLFMATRQALLDKHSQAEVDQLDDAARMLEYYWRKEI